MRYFSAIVNVLLITSFWLHGDIFESRDELKKFMESKRHFSFDVDRDNDGFPDVWFREKGTDVQNYHSILIDPALTGHKDKSSLLIGFSGGKTGVYSGPLKLSERYAYNLSLVFKSKNVDGNKFKHRMEFGLRAYDKEQRLIKSIGKTVVSFSKDWQKTDELRIETLPENTDSCTIFVQFSGRPSGRSFLWLDDVKIVQSPRIIFKTDKDLNIFSHGDKIKYSQSIEGTNPDEKYTFNISVTDFLGHVIEEDQMELVGQMPAIVRDFNMTKVPSDIAGVYYVNSTLSQNGKTLVKLNEILARNGPSQNMPLSPSFGVILGYPNPPYDNLLKSLELLGAKISKLDLFKDPFHLKKYSTDQGLLQLHDLLRKYAPDEGFQFIGVLNQIPEEANVHPQFDVNPAEHLIETFSDNTFAAEWKKPVLEDVLFKYGSVLSDWQIGDDSVPLSAEQIKQGKPVLDYLKEKAEWMKVLIPSEWTGEDDGDQKTVYVPAKMKLPELEATLKKNKYQNLAVTLELDSQLTTPRLDIISNLTKKIALLKSHQNAQGEPVVQRIFFDRLVDDHVGLMTPAYKPHSSYFAVKTMMEWMQGAEYLGRLTLRDRMIKNFVFENRGKAFVILWRDTLKKGIPFYLDDKITSMDLMGNQKHIPVNKDKSIQIDVGPTPFFVISPYPELFKTMLSFKLQNKDIAARVQLQEQVIAFKNHFPERAKLDCDIRYPQDWVMQGAVFSQELEKDEKGEHKMQLSPSAISELFPVHVTLDLDFSLKKNHHQVKLYRADVLNTDVKTELRFYKADEGIKMDIHIHLADSADTGSSFIASALMPDGETLEAYFKQVQPGNKSIQSLYIFGGQKFVGKEVNLEIKENVGDRYINQSYPITLSY